MPRTSNQNAGLTLIELVITLAVFAVTVTVVAPAMQSLLHGNRLRTEATRLLDALNLARSEAVMRNNPVVLCPRPAPGEDDASCDGLFANGWLVFSDSARNGRFDAGSDELIRVFEPLPQGYTLTDLAGGSSTRGPISYLPDGTSRRNISLLVCPPQELPLQPWSVVLNNVGRARMGRGEGRCPTVLP